MYFQKIHAKLQENHSRVWIWKGKMNQVMFGWKFQIIRAQEKNLQGSAARLTDGGGRQMKKVLQVSYTVKYFETYSYVVNCVIKYWY